MIDFIWDTKRFNIGLEKNVSEGFEEVEDEAGVNHLDIGSLGEIIAHADKHGGKDQHYGDVERYYCFKEKWFEIICGVSDEVQKKSWDEDSKGDTQESPTKYKLNHHLSRISNIFVPLIFSK